jgi:uncharacterized circularly permuted ATP-grasp superfamily protein
VTVVGVFVRFRAPLQLQQQLLSACKLISHPPQMSSIVAQQLQELSSVHTEHHRVLKHLDIQLIVFLLYSHHEYHSNISPYRKNSLLGYQ